jgi:hypothetical protein
MWTTSPFIEPASGKALVALLNLECRAGIEPANTGIADLRVDRFATGAFGTVDRSQPRPGHQLFTKNQKTHRAFWRVGCRDSIFLLRNLAQRTRPRSAALTAATHTHSGSEEMGHRILCWSSRQFIGDQPIICRLSDLPRYVKPKRP